MMSIKKTTVLKYFGLENDIRNEITPAPGAVQKQDIPKSTAYRWERNGWIEKRGERYVLTQKGYREAM